MIWWIVHRRPGDVLGRDERFALVVRLARVHLCRVGAQVVGWRLVRHVNLFWMVMDFTCLQGEKKFQNKLLIIREP